MALSCEKSNMENRIIGMLLSLFGIVSLIISTMNFMDGGTNTKNVKSVIAFGIIGAIFFFAGIGLIKTTKDKTV